MSARYCPKCGDILSVDGTTLNCQAGDMQFSEGMYRSLEDATIGLTTLEVELFDFTKQGMYCYCCGKKTQLMKAAFSYGCPHCGFVFSGLNIRRLVELHPHLRTDKFEYGYAKDT